MAKFPKDVRREDALAAMKRLGFYVVREREHIYLERVSADGKKTPMVMPNHRRIKSFTLRMILTQSGLTREEFLEALESR